MKNKNYYKEGFESGYWDAYLGFRLIICLTSPLYNYTAGYVDGQLKYRKEIKNG
jgi:hypothetical protein